MTHCKWNSGSVVAYNHMEWKAVPTQIMLSEMQSDQGKVSQCTKADILMHYAEWITLTLQLHNASAPHSVQGCGYGLSDWKIVSLLWGRFFHCVHTRYGTHPPIQWVWGFILWQWHNQWMKLTIHHQLVSEYKELYLCSHTHFCGVAAYWNPEVILLLPLKGNA